MLGQDGVGVACVPELVPHAESSMLNTKTRDRMAKKRRFTETPPSGSVTMAPGQTKTLSSIPMEKRASQAERPGVCSFLWREGWRAKPQGRSPGSRLMALLLAAFPPHGCGSGTVLAHVGYRQRA